MKHLKTTLILAAALSGVMPAPFATAQDQPADQAAEQQNEATGQVTGKAILPDQAPEGFHGGELDLSKAVVIVEGNYKRPDINLPENYKEMKPEERQAWMKAFMQSDAYRDYIEAMKVARAARPIYHGTLNADGTFTVEGVKPGKNYVTVVIPHEKADLASDALTRQSWAWARARPFQVEPDQTADAGELTLRLQNVVMPGEMAPQWTAKTYDGKELKLSDFRGKYVLMDFWATWCGPCKAEIPNLEAVYKDFGGDKFEIVGLSLDKDIELPKQFHKDNPSPYVHAYLGQWNKTETTARDYGVVGIPSIWLIGPDGKVVARDLRGEALREAVRNAVQANEQAKAD